MNLSKKQIGLIVGVIAVVATAVAVGVVLNMKNKKDTLQTSNSTSTYLFSSTSMDNEDDTPM